MSAFDGKFDYFVTRGLEGVGHAHDIIPQPLRNLYNVYNDLLTIRAFYYKGNHLISQNAAFYTANEYSRMHFREIKIWFQKLLREQIFKEEIISMVDGFELAFTRLVAEN